MTLRSLWNPVGDSRIVLLTSSSLANKGDALMLRAVTDRLGSGVRYAIPSNCAAASPRAATDFLVCLCTDRPAASKKRWLFNTAVDGLAVASAALPTRARHLARLVREDDVHVAVDLSGYCYGDHWGPALIEKSTRQYARYKERGIPVVLMPKTWGPFEKIGKRRVDALMDHVDLAFARDQTSLATLTACLSAANAKKVFFAPDYTHDVGARPQTVRYPDAAGRTIYIIPSYRVIDSGTLDKPRYLRLLALARAEIQRRGARPVLLIHETTSDLAFLRATDEMGFGKEEIVMEEDPVKMKELIAAAAGVVTSRLHGLYNALNSCVPVTVVPWNFKYGEALRQYGCDELLVDMTRPELSLPEKIELLMSPPERERVTSTMSAHRDDLARHTEAMWRRIEETISPALAR